MFVINFLFAGLLDEPLNVFCLQSQGCVPTPHRTLNGPLEDREEQLAEFDKKSAWD